jgi:hypothetical protein
MESNQDQEKRFIVAKKRVEKIKKFYKHLAIYIIVNIFLTSIFIIGDMDDGDTFAEAFFQYKNIAIWMYWGFGILYQALTIFGNGMFFSKDWEQRKIKEYANQQKNIR